MILIYALIPFILVPSIMLVYFVIRCLISKEYSESCRNLSVSKRGEHYIPPADTRYKRIKKTGSPRYYQFK